MVAWGLFGVKSFALAISLFCIRAGRLEGFRLSTSGHPATTLFPSFVAGRGQFHDRAHPLQKQLSIFFHSTRQRAFCVRGSSISRVKLDTCSSVGWQIENIVCKMVYDITSKEF